MIDTPSTDPSACPFCRAFETPGEILTTSLDATVGVLADGFPLTPGHALVVPASHRPDLLALEPATAAMLWATALEYARGVQLDDPSIDGFNFGVNVGSAAGQTVGHVHLHVVPRRRGDTTDPRGGVRWVVPENAAYWES